MGVVQGIASRTVASIAPRVRCTLIPRLARPPAPGIVTSIGPDGGPRRSRIQAAVRWLATAASPQAKHGGHHTGVTHHQGMADRINTGMYRVQVMRGDVTIDDALREAGGDQLPSGHDAVLPGSQRSNLFTPPHMRRWAV